MKKQLSYEQNIRAAIVFLNMFGVLVEERENIFLGNTLKVTSSEGLELGNVNIEEDRISITTRTDLGFLSAKYQLITASGSRDIESVGAPVFAQWNTDIDYTIMKNDIESFHGKFMVDCFADEKFEISCLCRHTLDYLVGGNKAMSLKFQLNGETFGVVFFDGNLQENIKLMPFDSLNGFIIHDIKKGDYGNDGFPYRKYSGIFSAGDELGHQFKAFTITSEYRDVQDFKQVYYDKNGCTKKSCGDDRETIVQMGTAMQALDPDMYAKIDYIKKLLTAGKTSLLDSFISVSLESFNDAEIQALFGITRNPLEYDDATKQLKHLYFGVKNQFKFPK